MAIPSGKFGWPEEWARMSRIRILVVSLAAARRTRPVNRNLTVPTVARTNPRAALILQSLTNPVNLRLQGAVVAPEAAVSPNLRAAVSPNLRAAVSPNLRAAVSPNLRAAAGSHLLVAEMEATRIAMGMVTVAIVIPTSPRAVVTIRSLADLTKMKMTVTKARTQIASHRPRILMTLTTKVVGPPQMTLAAVTRELC
jgi:hypothetical protein